MWYYGIVGSDTHKSLTGKTLSGFLYGFIWWCRTGGLWGERKRPFSCLRDFNAEMRPPSLVGMRVRITERR